MGKVYYHNITKCWYNENDIIDAVENTSIGDVIKFSISGNALLFDMDKIDRSTELNDEYSWVRLQFNELFEQHKQNNFL